MVAILKLISLVVVGYKWIIIVGALMSWLVVARIVNVSSPQVRQFLSAIDAVTEPLLKPIRRRLPVVGGLDFSPLVLIFACIAISDILIPYLIELVA